MSSSIVLVLALCFATCNAGREKGSKKYTTDESDHKYLVESDGAERHVAEYSVADRKARYDAVTFTSSLQTDPDKPKGDEESSESDQPESGKKQNSSKGGDPAPPQCPYGRKPQKTEFSYDCYHGCPEDAEGPDDEGNCKCKEGFLCYDNHVVKMAHDIALELKDAAKKKQVVEIVEEDQANHDAGCSALVGEGSNLKDANERLTMNSQVKFAHTCASCRCKSSGAAGIHLTIPLAITAFVLAILNL
eukprot:gnl/MRDRNA2_/MRDRNA2_95806_c0_seq1.p1 gnl/MRDRNA2_/MRDRNA2_95806_c0~~gnl/MRDRNA2_/MRDRNA2_95806_c0_seq1.p1  ORF type:complete len:281 (+),score=55.93 gnl/MRDRNA2_/MRDRNA2_95806_c0_seq1:103-843(+)